MGNAWSDVIASTIDPADASGLVQDDQGRGDPLIESERRGTGVEVNAHGITVTATVAIT